MNYVTEPRSVSHGTHRLEDLIPAFFYELENRQNDNLYTSDGDEIQGVALNESVTSVLSAIEKRMERRGYYETMEAESDLDHLGHMLQQYAGPELYFGAHEGDGSDFGYWPIRDEDDTEAWEEDDR